VLTFLKKAADDASSEQRTKIVAIYILLLAINAAAWTWAVMALADQPALLGTALLAYLLGLRHAVDADHIASIDNVVRKLMQEGKRPVSAGLFFSLGHSLAVTLAVAAISGAASPPSIWLFCAPSGRAFAARGAASRLPSKSLTFFSPAVVFWPAFFGPCSAWCREAGRCCRSVFCSASASIPRPRSPCSPSPRARHPAE